ncbi:MAG TPA: alpha-amylase family glycosyl hydrolase, partial [Rhizobiaceae bacterium]|nr:alpha-amylase family glycosyl hydrolase [Rhizobiaceae bacterium]
LCVDAVELMPVTAWIDERHLPPLGLANAWGYQVTGFYAPTSRFGTPDDFKHFVDALHRAGIGVILDLVFNHTGESDRHGATLSFRGIDNGAFYRHDRENPGLLVNDTGCGNTIACDHPRVRMMILDTLLHFVLHAGVDGFRFDLAPIMGRTAEGFDPGAETLRMIAADEWLADRVLIAEPWDIGPGGYALGRFGEPWLEWNDRCRDDIRRFWRGDGRAGDLATRLAGSFDIFAGDETRSVNLVACHDGFTLADLTAYRHKHNEANREGNRDGHDENFSWNHGVEGATDDPAIAAARTDDIKAMLVTLFASRGTIMLAAGDEFGRTQGGNNNAYAQDNETVWIDWMNRSRELEAFTASLASLRRRFAVLGNPNRLTGMAGGDGIADVEWLGTDGAPLSSGDWENGDLGCFAMVLATGDKAAPRIAFVFNRTGAPLRLHLRPSPQMEWVAWDKATPWPKTPPRSVSIVIEQDATAR